MTTDRTTAIAEICAHVEAEDFTAAASRWALHLYDHWQFHELMFNTALLANRESWRVSAVSAQATYCNWLVAIDKNLRGEVEALVVKWQREAA